MKDFGTVAQNKTEVRESPLLWIQGVDDYVSIQIDGTGTIASPTMTLYENGTDVSGTKLTGSMSVSGRVITTKTLQSLIGGNRYLVYISYTDDGVGQVRELQIVCPKLGVSPSTIPFAMNNLRVDESPIQIYPGQSYTSVLTVAGQGTIASPTMSIYKKTTDDSANSLSGNMSVSGRGITLKTISGLIGGAEYVAYVFFTDSGKSTVRYFDIICPKLGAY